MSIDFITIEAGPLQTNCYILWDKSTKKAAIIDPAGDRNEIIETVKNNNLLVEYILLTHAHFDHNFDAGYLSDYFGCNILMHKDDVPLLNSNSELAPMFYDMRDYNPFTPNKFIEHNDILELGNSEIKVLHSPGHSPGGVMFLTDIGVFVGDTIFNGSIGRTDFAGGSFPEIINSIKNNLYSLSDDTILYPGHGPKTTIGYEKKYNPYLN
ncbi:MAG: MBL fold metallo-hydrolase [Armatimonadota bacterium]